jgi:hypothetical protein
VLAHLGGSCWNAADRGANAAMAERISIDFGSLANNLAGTPSDGPNLAIHSCSQNCDSFYRTQIGKRKDAGNVE